MAAPNATKARAACRTGSARKDQVACLLCPLAAICRAQRARAVPDALDEQELKNLALAHGDIDLVALAIAGNAGRHSAIV